MGNNQLTKESRDMIKKFITGKVTREQIEEYKAGLDYSEFVRMNTAILIAIFIAKKIMADKGNP